MYKHEKYWKWMNYYTLFQLLRVVERIDKSNEGNVAVSNSLYIYIYMLGAAAALTNSTENV